MIRILIALCSIGLIVTVTGCGKTDDNSKSADTTTAPLAATSKGTIGVSVLTLTNPFFKVIGDTIANDAKKQGYDTIVVSGDFDVAKQQNQVKDFIVKRCAAIARANWMRPQK